MAVQVITVAFLLVATSVRFASSQFALGIPDYCLVSRIDVIECKLLNARTTAVPEDNEYGIYFTRYRSGAAGFPVCQILKRDHMIRDIEVIGRINKVMVFNSPGFTLDNARYGNQMYVDYNIQCGEGRLAFLNITSINMEGRVCVDPTRSNETRCVDYVLVRRGEYGTTESCGTEATENNDQFDLGSLKIIFRTSEMRRGVGFQATVVCFDREQANEEGCTRPQNATMSDTSTSTGEEMSRRKRDLEMFHAQWQRRAEYVKRIRRQAGGGLRSVLFRFQNIDVSHGFNVTFIDGTLEFINTRSNLADPEMTVYNVIILTTFDANGDVDTFKQEAVVGDVPIPLPGPGPMVIVGMHAYFQLFVIDPRGLIPNAEEMMVLANLTEAQLAVAQEDESERIDEELLNPPTVSPIEIGLPPIGAKRRRRRRRQANLPFDDQAVLTALENENACNPVLRASARSIIEDTDLERLQELRQLLADYGTI